ncbi:MAG: histidinol phosphatase [Lentisphaerae bacterium]|nr:histidinol phosphatase [Lentisphaerota bacterium]
MHRYETHLHTSETSKCAESTGAELALHFKRLGYTGIFVTDHFFNGNTTVPENLPWADRVEMFCRGYNMAARKGREIGLDVHFGWEYSHGWAHFLTYGLDQAWLLANPDLLSWDLLRYCDRVHEGGGSVVHAHPFREGVDIVKLVPDYVDAVEVLNGGRSDAYNRHALDYASSFALPKAAGSDIHSIGCRRLCGMDFARRLSCGRDYMAAVKSGEGLIIEARLDGPAPEVAG